MIDQQVDGLQFSEEEGRTLRQLARVPIGASAVALRARIILACAAGDTNAEAARRLGVSRETVRKWRDRFATHRLAGLADGPRSGAPRRIGDDLVRRVVTTTLELPAPTGDRWTTRSLAMSVGVSQTTVSRIWREYGLRTDRVRAWRLVNDPKFVATVHSVAGLYLTGRGSALVLAADRPDSPDSTLPSEAAPPSLAALHTVGGPDRAGRLLRFLAEVEAKVPTGTLHVLRADESGSDVRSVEGWLARRRRFRHQIIPACAPWPVLADRWLAAPRIADTPDAAELRTRVRRWARETGQISPMWIYDSRVDDSR